LKDEDLDVVCIGKIASIYDSVGVTEDLKAKNNQQSIDQTIHALQQNTRGLIFSNLVDFDMLYGHRRDVEGFARALEHFDSSLPAIEAAMREDDLMIITADHGNDPSFPGTDHTREYAPLLVYGKTARPGVNLGTRESLADIGQTIAENFGLKLTAGKSFLGELANRQD
jgi:phosphopentomutase